jgi:hypothetical protein
MAELNPQFDVSLRHLQNMNPEQLDKVVGYYGPVVSANLRTLVSSLPRDVTRVNVEKGIRRTFKVGSIKPGGSVSYGKMWSTLVPHTKQGFQYSAVCASSKTAIAATSESARLRAISVPVGGDLSSRARAARLRLGWGVFSQNGPMQLGVSHPAVMQQ